MSNKETISKTKEAEILHHLKQPLSAISGLAELTLKDIEEYPDINDEMSSNLHEIIEQVRRCSDIIESMKKSEQNKQKSFTPENINALISETLSNVNRFNNDGEITVRQQLDHKVPEINMHKESIRQLLTNLINNAIDSMKYSNKKILTVISQTNDRGIDIKVSDTGCGIRRNKVNNIFNSYYTTKGNNGTGLGLSISKSIVDSHDGMLTVNSEENMGSCFQVFLPKN